MNQYKAVVIDTNVLIYDPYALFSFGSSKVVVPMVVIEELDELKTDKTDLGYNARMVIKFLEQVSRLGDLSLGVAFNNENCPFLLNFTKQFDGVLQIMFSKAPLEAEAQLKISKNDNLILSVSREVIDSVGADHFAFVTKDVNLRIKARGLGINAIDFDHQPLNFKSIRGYHEFLVDADELKFISTKDLAGRFDLSAIINNEYVAIISNSNSERYRLFRYVSDKFVEVDASIELWSFSARSIPQAIAFDLLLDDSIPLVFLVGPAGTGKTLLTLLAGLYKSMEENVYDKLFVARPLVSLGADIGFVPGDLQEKLYHWMHPVFDNLDYIFREMDNSGQPFIVPKRIGANSLNRSSKKKYRSSTMSYDEDFSGAYEGNVHDVVASLQKKGLLGLEAITHMRGRSIPRQFMFIDEVQNLTPQEIKTIITRAGTGTKIILAGDPYQVDAANMDFYSNGLVTSLVKLRGEELVGCIFLDTSERSPLARVAIDKL